MATPLGRSVSIDAAAQLLKVTRRTIFNWIARGHLSTIRVGASQRVLVESIGLTKRSPQGRPNKREATLERGPKQDALEGARIAYD